LGRVHDRLFRFAPRPLDNDVVGSDGVGAGSVRSGAHSPLVVTASKFATLIFSHVTFRRLAPRFRTPPSRQSLPSFHRPISPWPSRILVAALVADAGACRGVGRARVRTLVIAGRVGGFLLHPNRFQRLPAVT